eukprot:COSAG06_NODE_11680_length_1475_cov_5.639332_1_plen_80_part_00
MIMKHDARANVRTRLSVDSQGAFVYMRSTIAGCGRTGGGGDGGGALAAEFNKPHEIRFGEPQQTFLLPRLFRCGFVSHC